MASPTVFERPRFKVCRGASTSGGRGNGVRDGGLGRRLKRGRWNLLLRGRWHNDLDVCLRVFERTTFDVRWGALISRGRSDGVRDGRLGRRLRRSGWNLMLRGRESRIRVRRRRNGRMGGLGGLIEILPPERLPRLKILKVDLQSSYQDLGMLDPGGRGELQDVILGVLDERYHVVGPFSVPAGLMGGIAIYCLSGVSTDAGNTR
jgi:hypothetical protein